MLKLVQISFSPILDDPRVRRNNDGLKELGWDVCAIGLAGGKSASPDWRIYTNSNESVDFGDALSGESIPLGKLIKRNIWFFAAFFIAMPFYFFGIILSLFGAKAAKDLLREAKIIRSDIGWPIRMLRHVKASKGLSFERALIELKRRHDIDGFIEIGRNVGAADIYVANDWTALPVAFALQGEFGGQVVYDSHEFALEEYAQNWAWRMFERPIAEQIEGHFIKQVRALSAVSLSIALELEKTYQLQIPCIEILNAPKNVGISTTGREIGDKIRVLYHGIVAEGRGLEAAVESVANWRDEFTFAIRGPSNPPEYLQSLKDLAQKFGVANRIEFLPPIAMTELVNSAREFDVGFFALPNHSAQNRFALPNKFFEYIQAGLCLLVSDLPEMKRYIDKYQCGALIKGAEAIEITKAVNSLDKSKIEQMKNESRAAALILNCQEEAKKLDNLYRAVIC